MQKTILIYDDDEEILFLCKAILESEKYRVETLSRCENVLADIELHKPDIILMDLWIPLIGGEKAIRIIKEDSQKKNIPVLLFSANSDIVAIAQNINADGYIAKPFEIIELKEIIEKNIS